MLMAITTELANLMLSRTNMYFRMASQRRLLWSRIQNILVVAEVVFSCLVLKFLGFGNLTKIFYSAIRICREIGLCLYLRRHFYFTYS